MPVSTQWDAHPLDAFKQFVKSTDFVRISKHSGANDRPPISDASASVYVYMFGKFALWMKDQHKVFSRITPRDLLQFLDYGDAPESKDLNSKIVYRYLRLIERCLAHLEMSPNAAQSAIFDAFKTGKVASDARTIALDDIQIAAFLEHLPPIDVPPGRGYASWKRRRDRAMQIVMLLGGLRVAETIGLLVEEITKQSRTDGGLELHITPVAKHDTSYDHTAVLPPIAARELLNWLAERRMLNIPGTLVFPADRQGAMLDKATLYRQVKATFQRAGMADVSRTGGRTLRNTFAVQEFQKGTPVPEVTESLGLALERSTQLYQDLSRREE